MIMADKYGQFAICPCCDEAGQFDFYGVVLGSAANPGFWKNEFVFRTPWIVPFGQDFNTYSSLDEGWLVDVSPERPMQDEAVINRSLAAIPILGQSERVWCRRADNVDHIDSPFASLGELLANGTNFDSSAWTKGATARYIKSTNALERTTDGSDATVYLQQSVTLSPDTTYDLVVFAKDREIDWVHIELRNAISTGVHAGAWFDISLVPPVPATLHSAGASAREVGNGDWGCVVQVRTGSSPGSTAVRITITDFDNTDSCTGVTGDGALIFWASLREQSPPLALSDLVNVNATVETITKLVYPRVFIPLNPGVNPYENALGDSGKDQEPRTAHGIVHGAEPARFVTKDGNDLLTLFLPVDPFEPFATKGHDYKDSMAINGDGTQLYFAQGGRGSINGQNEYDEMVYFFYDSTVPSDLPFVKNGSMSYAREIEYPLDFEDLLSASYDEAACVCVDADPTTANSGPDLPRIQVFPPHDGGAAFSLIRPRNYHFAVSGECPPCEDPPLTVWEYNWAANVTYYAQVIFAPPVQETLTVKTWELPVNDIQPSFEVEVLHGGAGPTLWTKSKMAPRIHRQTWRPDFINYEPAIGSPIEVSVMWADSVAGRGWCLAVAWLECDITIVGENPWDLNSAGIAPFEDGWDAPRFYYDFLINGNLVMNQREFWRPLEADVWGVMATFHQNYVIWFERVWTTRPTASTIGVQSHWRMHLTDGVTDWWYLDGNSLAQDNYGPPEGVTSSKEMVWVRNFGFDDNRWPRSVFGSQRYWAFSVERVFDSALGHYRPRYGSPAGTAGSDGFVESPNPAVRSMQPNTVDGLPQIDCVKDPDSVRLSTTPESYGELDPV